MSTCISRNGEFSEHTLDNSYTCTLCHVLDEEALCAELDKLRAECVRLDQDNTGLGRALTEARTEAERVKPVVDAVRVWRRLLGNAPDVEPLDAIVQAEGVMCAAVDALDGAADSPNSAAPRKLPVCVDCGHRHRPRGACADHSWTDSCQYDAGADCKAVAEERRRCPEVLLMSPDEVIVIRCVRDGGHGGNHWNRDREVEWEPIEAVAEVACSRCGGLDGTHTVRNCGSPGDQEVKGVPPTGSAGEKEKKS